MWKARSAKLKLGKTEDHSEGREGISSGMKRPPSDARPLRTTSSNDSWEVT